MPRNPPPKEHQFSSTNQPANRGRKKSILTKYKDKGVSTEDVTSAFSYVLGLKQSQLEKVVQERDKHPMVIVAAATAILKDINRGKLDNLSIVMKKARNNPELEDAKEAASQGVDDQGHQQFHEYAYPEADPLPE